MPIIIGELALWFYGYGGVYDLITAISYSA